MLCIEHTGHKRWQQPNVGTKTRPCGGSMLARCGCLSARPVAAWLVHRGHWPPTCSPPALPTRSASVWRWRPAHPVVACALARATAAWLAHRLGTRAVARRGNDDLLAPCPPFFEGLIEDYKGYLLVELFFVPSISFSIDYRKRKPLVHQLVVVVMLLASHH